MNLPKAVNNSLTKLRRLLTDVATLQPSDTLGTVGDLLILLLIGRLVFRVNQLPMATTTLHSSLL